VTALNVDKQGKPGTFHIKNELVHISREAGGRPPLKGGARGRWMSRKGRRRAPSRVCPASDKYEENMELLMSPEGSF